MPPKSTEPVDKDKVPLLNQRSPTNSSANRDSHETIQLSPTYSQNEDLSSLHAISTQPKTPSTMQTLIERRRQKKSNEVNTTIEYVTCPQESFLGEILLPILIIFRNF